MVKAGYCLNYFIPIFNIQLIYFNYYKTSKDINMIVAVGNVKGGVGKTTLAVNLAIARAAQGRDVLLIDGDEQGTAMTFTELRQEQARLADYTAVALSGASVRAQARQLAPKYDDLLIDVGGRDTRSLRAALTVAEVLLIPFQPRTFDVWAIDQMVSLIEEAALINEHLKAFSVLNAADAVGKDNDEAAAYLRQCTHIPYLDTPLVRRKSFPNAAAQGKGVLEYLPRDQKAVEELTRLIALIYQK